MTNGVPVSKIGVIGLVIVLAFLAAGVVLILFGHDDQGMQAIATATGVVIGTATTTTVAVSANGRARGVDDPPPPPTP
jgi:hypothetical protein